MVEGYRDFVAGTVGGFSGKLLDYPLDTVKVLLQTQNSLSSSTTTPSAASASASSTTATTSTSTTTADRRGILYRYSEQSFYGTIWYYMT